MKTPVQSIWFPIAFSFTSVAFGGTIDTVFDFENFASPSVSNSLGALTQTTFSRDGVEMTVTRAAGGGYDVVNQNQLFSGSILPFFPTGWGNQAISLFASSNDPADVLILSFAQDVHSLSLDFGNGGSPTITRSASIEAFETDASSTLVDADFASPPNGQTSVFTGGSLEVSGTFRTVIFAGGNSAGFFNNFWIDNIRVNADPIPSTAVSTLLLTACVVATRRRR